MSKGLCFLYLMILWSCSSIREKSSLLNNTASTQWLNVNKESSAHASEALIIHVNDRNTLQSILEIKPRGVFSYAPDSGFRGEAEFVKVIQNSQSVKNVEAKGKISQSAQIKAKENILVKQQQKQIKTRSKIVKPLFNNFNLLITGIVILLMIICTYKLLPSLKI